MELWIYSADGGLGISSFYQITFTPAGAGVEGWPAAIRPPPLPEPRTLDGHTSWRDALARPGGS
jgi:hypothetical protein